MRNDDLATRVKKLRKQNGLSQELLAENAGLSLRTIQRIENGETEPRGDTLKRLSNSLNTTPDEIIDWATKEDNGFLAALNLSALGFILFPLLGILIPLIMWVSKKDKIADVNKVAKELINFQISWTLLILITCIYFIVSSFYRIDQAQHISANLILGNLYFKYGLFIILYSYNFFLIIINTWNVKNGKTVKYFPKIRFLR